LSLQASARAHAELAASTTDAMTALRSANAQRLAATRKREAAEAAEFAALDAAGLNPYEVFLQRAREADAERQRLRGAQSVAAAKTGITAAVIAEDLAAVRTAKATGVATAAEHEEDLK
jgi:hypothetical protein